MPDCQNCPLKEQVTRLETKYSESRQRIYERLEKLETESARVDEKYKSIMQDLEELKKQQGKILNQIEALTQQPAKRWDNVISSSISTIVGVIVGFVASHINGGV